jgi:hypothetical protein
VIIIGGVLFVNGRLFDMIFLDFTVMKVITEKGSVGLDVDKVVFVA